MPRSRGAYPRTVTSLGRIPNRASPRLTCGIDSQRPTIHRSRLCRLAVLAGLDPRPRSGGWRGACRRGRTLGACSVGSTAGGYACWYGLGGACVLGCGLTTACAELPPFDLCQRAPSYIVTDIPSCGSAVGRTGPRLRTFLGSPPHQKYHRWEVTTQFAACSAQRTQDLKAGCLAGFGGLMGLWGVLWGFSGHTLGSVGASMGLQRGRRGIRRALSGLDGVFSGH